MANLQIAKILKDLMKEKDIANVASLVKAINECNKSDANLQINPDQLRPLLSGTVVSLKLDVYKAISTYLKKEGKKVDGPLFEKEELLSDLVERGVHFFIPAKDEEN